MTVPHGSGTQVLDKTGRLRHPLEAGEVSRHLLRLLTGEVALAVGLSIAVLALVFPYLESPYYWDSTQYIAGADYIMRHSLSPLLPQEWDVVGHPTLFLQILALAWLALGQSALVSHLLIAVFAFGTVYFTYRVGQLLFSRSVGLVAAVLLLFYPLFRTQSTVIALDLPAAAFAILCIYFFLRGRTWPCLLCGCAMVLTKETTVLLVPCMLLYILMRDWRRKPWPRLLGTLALYSVPALVLVGWFWYHVQATGWLAPADYPLSMSDMVGAYLPPKIFSSAGGPYMFLSLSASYFGKMFLIGILTVLMILYSFNLRPFVALLRRSRPGLTTAGALRAQPVLRVWGPVQNLAILALPIALHLAFMSTNFTLQRYLLPEYCLFFILAAGAVVGIFRQPQFILPSATAILIIFVVGWVKPWFGYSLPSPSTMMYTDFVETHREASAFLESRYPGKVVLAGWPQYVELGMPLQGYVAKPMKVVSYAYADAARFKSRITSIGGRYYTDTSTLTTADFDLVYSSSDSLQPGIDEIIKRYDLPLIVEFEKGQEHVAIYGKP